MPTRPLDDATLLATIEAVTKAGGNISAAARELDLHESTVRNRIDLAAMRGIGIDPPVSVPSGFEIAKLSERQNEAGKIQGRNVQMRQVRPEAEPIPEGFEASKVSVYTDGNGREIGRWTQAKPGADLREAYIAQIEERFSKLRTAPAIKAPPATDTDLLTVYPVADAHIGQLSWGRETGQSYDIETATRCLREGVAGLLTSTPRSAYAILLILGDFLHVDDHTNETKRSKHKLDADGRFHKIALSAADVAEEMALAIGQHHRDVKIVILPGNHDDNAYLIPLAALRAVFRDHGRITVHDKPGAHFFERFGKNVIGATHGHLLKIEKMPELLIRECREWLSECPYNYVYSGHVHHKKTHEGHGVICRSMSPVTARDAYAYGGGFYSARGLAAITHHRLKGFHMETFHPFPDPRPDEAA